MTRRLLSWMLLAPGCRCYTLGRAARAYTVADLSSISACASSRPIGSVVGNLHGGKYQFGASSATSSEFAEALARTGERDAAAAGVEQQDQPRWATLQPQPSEAIGELQLTPGGAARAISFSNAFMSWERWYAATTTPEFELSQAEGQLAPRGGANNVCDPGQRYSDAASLKVRCVDTPPVGVEAYLVVQTEEAQWTWKLSVAPPG